VPGQWHPHPHSHSHLLPIYLPTDTLSCPILSTHLTTTALSLRATARQARYVNKTTEEGREGGYSTVDGMKEDEMMMMKEDEMMVFDTDRDS
jgi:fluoride ion exporter CrcB/FEX